MIAFFSSSELLSMSVLTLSETPVKESMELAVISNFHHRRTDGGLNFGFLNPKLNLGFNYLAQGLESVGYTIILLLVFTFRSSRHHSG